MRSEKGSEALDEPLCKRHKRGVEARAWSDTPTSVRLPAGTTTTRDAPPPSSAHDGGDVEAEHAMIAVALTNRGCATATVVPAHSDTLTAEKVANRVASVARVASAPPPDTPLLEAKEKVPATHALGTCARRRRWPLNTLPRPLRKSLVLSYAVSRPSLVFCAASSAKWTAASAAAAAASAASRASWATSVPATTASLATDGRACQPNIG